jgi:hypothetical protein
MFIPSYVKPPTSSKIEKGSLIFTLMKKCKKCKAIPLTGREGQ